MLFIVINVAFSKGIKHNAERPESTFQKHQSATQNNQRIEPNKKNNKTQQSLRPAQTIITATP